MGSKNVPNTIIIIKVEELKATSSSRTKTAPLGPVSHGRIEAKEAELWFASSVRSTILERESGPRRTTQQGGQNANGTRRSEMLGPRLKRNNDKLIGISLQTIQQSQNQSTADLLQKRKHQKSRSPFNEHRLTSKQPSHQNKSFILFCTKNSVNKRKVKSLPLQWGVFILNWLDPGSTTSQIDTDGPFLCVCEEVIPTLKNILHWNLLCHIIKVQCKKLTVLSLTTVFTIPNMLLF